MDRRKLNRKFLGMLSEGLRLALMRKKVRINPSWPSPLLTIKIADTEEELASAYRLLHDSYVKSGFMNPDPTGMRVLPQHLLPQTTTIIAVWEDKVIGTLSLIRDNPFGLPLEKVFDVSNRRTSGKRLAEVSSLAVDPLYRGQINQALFPLFRFVYQYARDCFGIHEFVIAVNPSMVDLYLGFICFEKLKAKPKAYDFVKGAPAVGLFMNFETVIERWKETFNHRPMTGNFYRYWNDTPSDERNKMPKRNYHSSSDPILTPELLKNFFLERAQLASRLTFQEVKVLMDAYPFPGFEEILRPLCITISRKNVRIETQMKAEVGAEKIQAEVLNVSSEGMLLRTKSDCLTLGQKINVIVWLNQNSSTNLSVEVRWCPKNSLFGLKIIETTKEWSLMIQTLESEYKKLSGTHSIKENKAA